MKVQKVDQFYEKPLEDNILLSRNAVIVIHGIGEQFPLQTLDNFSQTFKKALNNFYKPKGCDYRFIHRQANFELPAERELWIENYISIEAGPDYPVFDVYEYYWAHQMTDQATIDDVIKWLNKASKNASRRYSNGTIKENIEERRDKDQEPTVKKFYDSNNEFVSDCFIRSIGLGTIIWFLIRALETTLLSRVPFFYNLYKFLKAKAEETIVKYIGDAVVYTTTDRKMRHYDVRKKIIYDARLFIELLLKNPKYNAVFIAGHSLGSVIAYDVLARIQKRPIKEDKADDAEKWQAAYNKIKGLFTFGSPLDKINLYFNQLKEESEILRIQMTENIYSFKKSSSKKGNSENEIMEDQTIENIKDVPWLNIYDGNDPISDRLYLFNVDRQINLEMKEKYGIAHTKYWEDERVYKYFLEKFDEERVFPANNEEL